MVKEIKALTLNDAEVLRVIARFSREIKKTGLGKYFEEEFVRDGRGRDGVTFWIFDGPHEDAFGEVLEEQIRKIEEAKPTNNSLRLL